MKYVLLIVAVILFAAAYFTFKHSEGYFLLFLIGGYSFLKWGIQELKKSK